ncbi:MAG: MaoC family dehydratase [Pseudomonadota bacterium]
MGRFANVGESHSRSVTLDAAAIRAFATACGDFNPLHHDAAAAARSRFGRLIASGPHTASLLLGLSATWFAQRGTPLGLDYTIRFRKAVCAGDTLTLRWTVVAVHWKESLRGELVTLDGEIRNQHDECVLTSNGLLLVTDAP